MKKKPPDGSKDFKMKRGNGTKPTRAACFTDQKGLFLVVVRKPYLGFYKGCESQQKTSKKDVGWTSQVDSPTTKTKLFNTMSPQNGKDPEGEKKEWGGKKNIRWGEAENLLCRSTEWAQSGLQGATKRTTQVLNQNGGMVKRGQHLPSGSHQNGGDTTKN